ncbi:MAG: ATP-binding protein [Parvularcula sp.]
MVGGEVRLGGQVAGMLSRRSIVPRILRTTAFRYTMAFFLLLTLFVGGLGYFVYATTLRATMARYDAELIGELTYLAQVNRQSGVDGVAGLNAVNNEVARLSIVQKDALYMVLVGFEGRPFVKLSSDIDTLPPNALASDGLFKFQYTARSVNSETGKEETEKRPAVGRIANFLYSGVNGEKVRAVILTARDISEVEEIQAVARQTVIRAGSIALLIALGLGALYSGVFLRRVDTINQTVKAIRGGDLTRRVALSGTRDEFDTLSENINGMLDQIERLMTGMKQVSDNIAHDLRSPLTRIKARLDAVSGATEDELREVVEQTSDDVERLLATFNALLSITRIEAGEGGGTDVPVDVSSVARELLELYEPAADDEGFVLKSDIQPTPEIKGSRELISQAIANLLDNALKYAKRESDDPVTPTIELTVAPRGDGGVLLSVMDNGPGVSEADYERILKRFVRLEQSRSTTGNGLGLSLVAAIARRHHATLTVTRGLPHDPAEKGLLSPNAYGLGVRLLFSPPMEKPSKKK